MPIPDVTTKDGDIYRKAVLTCAEVRRPGLWRRIGWGLKLRVPEIGRTRTEERQASLLSEKSVLQSSDVLWTTVHSCPTRSPLSPKTGDNSSAIISTSSLITANIHIFGICCPDKAKKAAEQMSRRQKKQLFDNKIYFASIAWQAVIAIIL